MAAVQQRNISALRERWCFSHFYSKCVSISFFPDRLLFGPPKAGWTRMGPSAFFHWSSGPVPKHLAASLLNFMTLLVPFLNWGAQNWMQHLDMVQQVVWVERLDRFPFCSSSAPVSAAQGALGLCCHQETLLAHMLLDPLSVHQVLNTTGSHSVPTSSSARVFSFLVEVLPFVLTEFYEVSVSPSLQTAELSVSGSPTLNSVNWFLPV